MTFRNWRLDDAIRETPLNRLLVETDAPYLAPVPYRGKRNEPAFVRQVAERVAQVRELPAEELIALTGANVGIDWIDGDPKAAQVRPATVLPRSSRATFVQAAMGVCVAYDVSACFQDCRAECPGNVSSTLVRHVCQQ